MRCSRALLVPLALLCTQCAWTEPQPVADLEKAATPPAAEKPAPVVLSPRSLSQDGKFRAYVPPRISANGDVIGGHEVELTEHEPADVVVQPTVAIPRAPLHPQAPKPAQSRTRILQAPAPAQGSPPVPAETPTVPPGFSQFFQKGIPHVPVTP
jgi:hypothetical protein